ncbi:OadG family protein [Stakelama tenebrarum]|uniref:OadG family protein n=1 Tax=Stakelama tenebrarum TaxID=2711215 RepID=A0A6G6Y4W8_9SPHN|nr:OadG family protein [Sphingosinithalassobacter tenebrarum]QIG79891.1 OadG family protein [Sphingosinithalassobacter tenebrarum]
MRFTACLAAFAAMAMLAGCDSGNGNKKGDKPDLATREAAAAFAATGTPFDYRYAFRLPGDAIKQVVESNEDACRQLAENRRCEVLAMRYSVEDASKVSAVLTLKIDPTIARGFGDEVTQSVMESDGVLLDTQVMSGEAGISRQASTTERLQRALSEAESKPDDAEAQADAEAIRAALDTIERVDGESNTSFATAPVLITYESSGPMTVLGNGKADLKSAGETLQDSLARLAQLLAAFGPWVIALFILVFILRWIIHRTEAAAEPAPVHDPAPNAVPVEEDPDDRGNLIQRWFARDDEDED